MRLKSGSETHPYADLYPRMTAERFAELVTSMRTRGFDAREPVVRVVTKVRPPSGKGWIEKKLVVDGRHREDAGIEAGVRIVYSDHRYDEATDHAEGLGDLLTYVRTKNARRDLTDEQRVLIAAKIADLPRGRPANTPPPMQAKGKTSKAKTENPPRGGFPAPSSAAPAKKVTQAEAAKMMHVSERSVQRAKVVIDNAVPEIREAVESGRLPVAPAAAIAALPKPQQREIAKRPEFKSGKPIRPGWAGAMVKQQRRAEQAAEIAGKPAPPPTGPFPVIIYDHPWKYESRRDDPSQRGQVDYAEMTIEEGCALPVPQLAEKDCALWFWITNPFFLQAAHLPFFEAWGFTARAIVTWDKVNPSPGNTLFNVTEHVILATRGDPPITVVNETTIMREKRREHSRKPEAFYELVAAVTKGHVLEMFSRTPRDGYAQWGAEVGRFEQEPQKRLLG